MVLSRSALGVGDYFAADCGLDVLVTLRVPGCWARLCKVIASVVFFFCV